MMSIETAGLEVQERICAALEKIANCLDRLQAKIQSDEPEEKEGE